MYDSYRRAHANRGQAIGSIETEPSGPVESDSERGPRGESGSGRSDEATLPSRTEHRATGATGGEVSRSGPRKHPNCDRGEVTGGVCAMTRFPGQRERRRGGQRNRATGTPGSSTPVTEVGQPAVGVGAAHSEGFARRWRVERQQGRATDRLAEKGIARRLPLGKRRAMCRSERRLTPHSRPVVDRSTFWVGPGRLRQRKQAAPPGASHLFLLRRRRRMTPAPAPSTQRHERGRSATFV
jgi:hypothetical protein